MDLPLRLNDRFVFFGCDIRRTPVISHSCPVFESCFHGSQDLFRHFTSNTWGATEGVLLGLFISLVRSWLYYGCVIYGQRSNSYLRLVDPIQNEALLITTGLSDPRQRRARRFWSDASVIEEIAPNVILVCPSLNFSTIGFESSSQHDCLSLNILAFYLGRG